MEYSKRLVISILPFKIYYQVINSLLRVILHMFHCLIQCTLRTKLLFSWIAEAVINMKQFQTSHSATCIKKHMIHVLHCYQIHNTAFFFTSQIQDWAALSTKNLSNFSHITIFTIFISINLCMHMYIRVNFGCVFKFVRKERK